MEKQPRLTNVALCALALEQAADRLALAKSDGDAQIVASARAQFALSAEAFAVAKNTAAAMPATEERKRKPRVAKETGTLPGLGNGTAADGGAAS